MKRIPVVLLLAAFLALAPAAPAGAGGATLGTHLGIGTYVPDEGDALTMLAWPSQSGILLPVVAPALRVGVFLDEARRHHLLFDTGLAYLNSESSSFTNFQFMGSYQLHLGGGATQPFLNAGVGMLAIGDDDDSSSCPVLGAGVGVRHVLGREQGALRAEVRVDQQFESQEDGYTVLNSWTAVSLRLGFDLFLR